jgi:NADH:ubiquinone oxidoreductase subunit E
VSKGNVKLPECILYVCCGSKCRKQGGKQRFKQLKNAVKERGLKSEIQVIKTGCTGNCKRGPIVAMMPRNEWHIHVDEKQAITLLDQAIEQNPGLRK